MWTKGGPPPKGMKYDSQVIVCFDGSLSKTSEALQAKRAAAGEVGKSHEIDGDIYKDRFPDDWIGGSARLYVIGHGEAAKTQITTSSGPRSAEEIANRIRTWLDGRKVKRISLHVCYGAGMNAGYKQHPVETSFAYAFAKHMDGVTEDITARRNKVFAVMSVEKDSQKVASFRREVGAASSKHNVEQLNGYHRVGDDKVILTPGEIPKFRNARD